MRRLALLGLAAALAGCTTPYADEPRYRPPALDRRPAPATTTVSPGAPAVDSAPTTDAVRPDARGALTLDDCLARARAHDRSLRIADRRILIARDKVAEAWGTVMPKLAAEGSFQVRSNDPGATLGGSPVVTGPRELQALRIGLLVPIYDFGASINRRDTEELRVGAAQTTAERARQDLEFAVRAAYYRVLEAERIRQVVAESIALVERQLAIARDFLGQGLVAANDVLTVEVQLAQRRQDLIQAENNVELALATLGRRIGTEVAAARDLADVLETTPWEGSYESVLRLALEQRPDLATLRRQVEIARAEYRATRAGLAPSIYAFGALDTSSDEFLLHQDWVSGGIAVKFPLFDGGVTLARARADRNRIEEAIDLHDERVDDIVLDLKRAWLDLTATARRIPVAAQGIELGRENLRIVRDQYAAGLLTSADVLTEEDRLSRARSGYYQALYDYHATFARLVHEIGAPPPAP